MNWSDYNILLVDDEKDILEFLSYNLSNEGFKIFTASNGKDAVKIAGEVRPNLVLMDVMMPEMDGIAACEEIRNNRDLAHTIPGDAGRESEKRIVSGDLVIDKERYMVVRTIDIHIRKLREKIGEKYIATVKGIGYKFVSPS
jgi:DNA-binding response OmpR family regulator